MLLEKTLYYRVQAECLGAAVAASPEDRIVFREAARLGEALGAALEDDAIHADDLLLWKRYARELESVIRLAGRGLESREVSERLKTSAELIDRPKGVQG